MKKFLLYLLVFLSFIALFLRFMYKPMLTYFGGVTRAGIRVESNKKAKVFINDSPVGNTPYQDEGLNEGDFLIKIQPEITDVEKEASASANMTPFWQGTVRLTSGTLTVVNREIGDSVQTSSGEVITLEKGRGVTIVSVPSSAEVIVDGKSVGLSPVSVSEISPGEHQFIISRDNYLKRSVRATIIEGYMLNLNIDLSIAEADLTKVPINPITSANQEVTVKKTPTGFLRVRANADTSSKEISRLSPGDVVTLIEEMPNWMKVKLKDGQEGYVSSLYVEKKT